MCGHVNGFAYQSQEIAQIANAQSIDIAVDNNNDGIIDAVGPRTQFKEVLGVGLSYKF